MQKASANYADIYVIYIMFMIVIMIYIMFMIVIM